MQCWAHRGVGVVRRERVTDEARPHRSGVHDGGDELHGDELRVAVLLETCVGRLGRALDVGERPPLAAVAAVGQLRGRLGGPRVELQLCGRHLVVGHKVPLDLGRGVHVVVAGDERVGRVHPAEVVGAHALEGLGAGPAHDALQAAEEGVLCTAAPGGIHTCVSSGVVEARMRESDEFDAISGTSGIQGVADTLIVLTSKRKSKDVTKLFLTSRDLEPLEKEIKLDSSFWWEVIGNVGDDNTAKQTVLQDHIIEAVKWWTVKPISNSTAKLFEEDAIKKIPKNENIIQACSPKQICEYFVLAQTLNIHNEPYKESTIKKETQRMRDKYNLLQSGVDPHTYRLQSF